MTDDELWEWMQRDLDKDLTPEEQQVLYTILAKEPLLQQKYKRLQQVSQRLAELPPVTPPFSIVDSILPQLESAAATPAAKAVGSRETLPAAEVKRVSSAQSAGSREQSRVFVWFARLGSVAVAASLFIGVLVINDDMHRQEEDVSHNGATIPSPVVEPPAIYGPSVPPPSTDITPTSIPVEEKTEEPPAKQPVKQPVQEPSPPPAQTSPPAVSEQKPDPTGVRPPIIPPPPVPREPKPPAFPFGLEEKSDDDIQSRIADEQRDEEKEDDQGDEDGKDRRDLEKESNGPRDEKAEKEQGNKEEKKESKRDQDDEDE